MPYLFVGEDRSATARRRNWYWEDGRLAAKQLFDALLACGIDPQACRFVNLFDRSILPWQIILAAFEQGWRIVAMGRRVETAMRYTGITHVPIIHPAARGTIRRKDRYAAHVRERLGVA